MYRTRPNLRLASTKRGMRRILKYQGPVNEYIRQAVLAGTYRTTEELERVKKERRESADDLQTIMRRFRQDIVRGSAVTDYPIEYLILQSHPPVPDPPRLNRKLERQMKEPPSPLAKLVQKHLKQHGDDRGSRTAPVGHRSTEEYYRHLLGVAAPSTQTALGNKTAQVQKAYAKAVKQYELMRVDGLSEADAMLRVDDLLEEQARNEKTMSTQRVKAAQAFRERVGPEFKIHNMAREAKAEIDQQEQRRASNTANDSSENAAEEPFLGATQNFELLASVFANDATKIQGLMRWSERLAAVPYTEWTIGASTALDHWMARQLLGMSEETWATLLEGDSPDLLAQGRDLVRLRETLFPETILEAPDSIVDESEEEAPAVEEEDPAEKSIEELLASLGGLKTSGETGGNRKKPSSSSWSWLEDLGSADLDVRIDRFVEQLQDWRYRNVQTPYNEWPQPDQNEFSEWLKEFVESVSSDAERGTIDYVATRKALLSSPPVDREQAGAFWSNLQHDTQAISLLDAMRADGPPPGASILHAAFWDLPYDTQLECLLNLGALRPILDEYTKESDRLAFLHRFGDIVLAGVELEHLVPDPVGPVTTADLSPATVEEMKIHPSSRFRLEKRPYMSESNIAADEKSRALFHAWNQHKAGRARYEEKLFQTGRLGLRYSDRIPRHDEFPEEEKK